MLKLNEAVKNVAEHTSLPLWEVVAAASLNPANSIGMGDTKGSITVGKDADLVIADKDFNIKKTIIQGDIRYEA